MGSQQSSSVARVGSVPPGACDDDSLESCEQCTRPVHDDNRADRCRARCAGGQCRRRGHDDYAQLCLLHYTQLRGAFDAMANNGDHADSPSNLSDSQWHELLAHWLAIPMSADQRVTLRDEWFHDLLASHRTQQPPPSSAQVVVAADDDDEQVERALVASIARRARDQRWSAAQFEHFWSAVTVCLEPQLQGDRQLALHVCRELRERQWSATRRAAVARKVRIITAQLRLRRE